MGLVVVFIAFLFLFPLARAFNKLNAIVGARRARGKKDKHAVNTTTKPTPHLVDVNKQGPDRELQVLRLITGK